MNASWSIVFGALLAGLVGGFMIPTRPEIRDVPALTAKATEPAKKSTDDKVVTPVAAKAEDTTASAATESEPAQPAAKTADGDCSKETWPYRSPNCLDRSAKVAPADTVVPARRIDPAPTTATKETPKETPKTTAAAPEPAPQPAAPAPKAAETPTPKAAEAAASKPAPAKSEPAKPEQKVVTTPPASEQRIERPASQPAQAAAPRPAPQTEQAATRPATEPRAQTTERQEASSEQPRRPARRANRNPYEEFDDGVPTRIYLRGPDGRLYLAPEHRPSRGQVYIMR